MVKTIELIVVITLLIFSFFAGVKYSDSVKDHASWLFETKEEEVELPDLSNEATTPEGVEISNPQNMAPQEGGAPMDDLEPTNTDHLAPAQQPAAAPAQPAQAAPAAAH
jgi:hypothetical protein